jgi:hypothetical protein
MAGSCGWFPMNHRDILAWVESHHDTLPRTLAELSAFPVPFRKVIVNYVSPEQRTAFWREHLSSFVQPDSTLTDDQQTLVRDAIADLPLLFNGTRPEFEARAMALENRMRDLLSRHQAAEMFGMVGPPEPEGGLPLPPGAQPSAPE